MGQSMVRYGCSFCTPDGFRSTETFDRPGRNRCSALKPGRGSNSSVRLSASNSTITYTHRQAEGAHGHSHLGHDTGSRGFKNGAKSTALSGLAGRVRELYG